MKIKSLLAVGLIVASIGLAGCSATDDFKDGAKESFNKTIEEGTKNDEEAKAELDAKAESLELATMITEVGEKLSTLDGATEEEIKEVVSKFSDEAYEKINYLAEYDTEEAQMIKEGYVLMDNAMTQTLEGQLEASKITLEELNKKCEEIATAVNK